MIRTIVAFIVVVIASLFVTPFGIIAGVAGLLGLRKIRLAIMYPAMIFWSRLLLKMTGCKISAKGRENIPLKGGVCFVCNHSGIADIVLFAGYCRRVVGFIAKKELIFVPIINLWIYLLGGLFIDRKNPRKALKTINKGVEKIKAGGSMIIFPEGSRSRGRGLLPFHPGSLKLATQAEAVIVPVAISGTYELFEKKRRVDSSVHIKISFCKPVNTSEIPLTERKQALADRIFAVIKEELENGRAGIRTPDIHGVNVAL